MSYFVMMPPKPTGGVAFPPLFRLPTNSKPMAATPENACIPQSVEPGSSPATLLAVLVLRWFLSRFTDSTVPGWDGLTTALSLAATYGQCRKLLESWWIWIAADVIYIPLYIYKHLRLTSGLYFVFFLLCVMGLREWSNALRQQRESVPA